ncbi:MAG: dTDP-glucose 4,6-dehydratase [Dehalococcoidia bacterium]|nr:dTDP-glucose 4,6-dehydratase [Dehalococcoidia bacterium]
MRRILVTGGMGFIGSHFVRRLLTRYDNYEVVNLDKLTYAGNPDNLRDVEGDPRYRFVQGDICDEALVAEVMRGVDAVVNFAAESHVDRSLMEPSAFIQTDVFGTYVLLGAAAARGGIERFLHVSTDEVYGEVPEPRRSREDDPLRPRSPYAASKAGADMQCLAFIETYGLPVVIARPSNNVGPNQYPEKMAPLFITNALDDEPLPVYGDGRQVRDWLFVEDNCEALDLLLHEGAPGEIYNVGAGNERPNIETAEMILSLLGKPRSLIRFVEDRPGHDRRYCLDWAKIRSLGWSPRHNLATALEATVRWYVDNRWWWEKIKSGTFREYYRQQYGKRLASSTSGVPGEA